MSRQICTIGPRKRVDYFFRSKNRIVKLRIGSHKNQRKNMKYYLPISRSKLMGVEHTTAVLVCKKRNNSRRRREVDYLRVCFSFERRRESSSSNNSPPSRRRRHRSAAAAGLLLVLCAPLLCCSHVSALCSEGAGSPWSCKLLMHFICGTTRSPPVFFSKKHQL